MSPKLCESTCCTGCGACRNACPVDAISFVYDEEGFLSPQIDYKLCVGCKRCETACPVLHPPKHERLARPIVYACWNVDDVVRAKSTSGGMFSVYANKILEQKGVVFGVGFNDDRRAVFLKAESADELVKIRSSKYVQADVGTIYRSARTELETGRPVLFSGVPCQVAALRAYLGKDYPNLFTCDLICHGTPSPTLFKKWIEELDNKYARRLETVVHRAKERGWARMTATFVFSGKGSRKIVAWKNRKADYLGLFFMKNVSLRSSCGQCQFATTLRQGDVTLGDFWTLGSETPFEKREEIPRGVSLNLINTDKGARLVESCKDSADWFERPLDEAKKGNGTLVRPSELHPLRNQFVRDSVNLNYLELCRKYRRKLRPTFKERVKKRLGKIVGKKIRNKFPQLFETSSR